MNLKVKIPKKFKRELSKRFNYRNREECLYTFGIGIDCPLCEAYQPPICKGCPFKRFGSPHNGCLIWMRKLIGSYHFTIYTNGFFWYEKNSKLVKAELSQLRLKSKELIEWI